MPYEIVKHTADLRMRVRGETLEHLFSEAFTGMMEILKPGRGDRNGKISRTVTIYASDRTALLVDFLNEVLSLCQINKEAYREVSFSTFSEIALEATVHGSKVESFDEDIKAVTYHEAEAKQNKRGGWGTTLVFDI